MLGRRARELGVVRDDRCGLVERDQPPHELLGEAGRGVAGGQQPVERAVVRQAAHLDRPLDDLGARGDGLAIHVDGDAAVAEPDHRHDAQVDVGVRAGG